jgi:hypothetical protein
MRVMPVPVRTLPAKALVLPRVAAELTIQYTLQADAPFVRETTEPLLVVSEEPIWIMYSPAPDKVNVPSRVTAESKLKTPGCSTRPARLAIAP